MPASSLNMALWNKLRSQPDRWLSPHEIAHAVGIREEQLRDEFSALEAFGFGIERHPHLGLRYGHPATRLCPDQIQWRLGTEVIGRQLFVWNRVTSTNDLAARAAVSPLNEGLVVMAEEQTAGRGRRGRAWHALPGSSLLMSVVLFPPEPLREAGLLTALAAVAVARLAEAVCRRAVHIKWPNDVEIAGRKIAGILVEQSAAGYVLGIGINVNVALEDLPVALRATAGTLRQFAGTLDRSQLARALLRRLDRLYWLARRQGPETVCIRWRKRALPPGTPVQVELVDGRICGVLRELDPLPLVWRVAKNPGQPAIGDRSETSLPRHRGK